MSNGYTKGKIGGRESGAAPHIGCTEQGQTSNNQTTLQDPGLSYAGRSLWKTWYLTTVFA